MESFTDEEILAEFRETDDGADDNSDNPRWRPSATYYKIWHQLQLEQFVAPLGSSS